MGFILCAIVILIAVLALVGTIALTPPLIAVLFILVTAVLLLGGAGWFGFDRWHRP